MEEINKTINTAKEEAKAAQTIVHLMQEIKPKYLGKGSLISQLSEQIRAGSPEQKREIGGKMKQLKDSLEEIFAQRLSQLEAEEIDKKLKENAVDASLSLSYMPKGSLHPLSIAAKQMISIFQKYGCKVITDKEIGSVTENFDLLNVTEDHPARQMHDTFYLRGIEEKTGQHYLLRTHTTGLDIKALKEHGAPIRTVGFGKVFRRDMDSTHSPMFHQFDLLMVEKGLNLGNLKFILTTFLQEFFQTEDVELRMRPSFFPFTEPSVEIDVRYSIVDNKIVLNRQGDKYMEILGCGVLRPVVLENCGINPEEYTAIAAGIGLERMVMLKYGFKDIRSFFTSDILWLEEAQEAMLFGQE